MTERKSLQRYRLGSGVEILPVEELPPEILQRVSQTEFRYVVVRPNARTGPLLIDDEMAAILEEFQRPATMAGSMLRYGQRCDRDPVEVFEGVYATLKLLVERRYLLPASESGPESPSWMPLTSGDWIDDLEVIWPISRMEDTEVFQVRMNDRQLGALKMAVSSSPKVAARLEREAAMLRSLDGDPSPRLLRASDHDGRSYLLLEWRNGIDLHGAALDWTRRDGDGGRVRRLAAGVEIASIYANLHERGVIHGDVSWRNILVDRRGSVTVLDFEYARWIRSTGRDRSDLDRGGVPLLFDPEFAQAALDGVAPPQATVAGEQYSVAALLYELISGSPYIDFDLRWEVMLGQIVEEPPLAFAARGLSPWPEVESVLARALAKDPIDRFQSTGGLADALRSITPIQGSSYQVPGSGTGSRNLVDHTFSMAGLDGPWMSGEPIQTPRYSIAYGAAGVALALCRLSRLKGQTAPLELSDIWIRRALESARDEPALPKSSLYTGAAGVMSVEAVVAGAQSDSNRLGIAQVGLEISLESPPEDLDLFDGRAGALLGTAWLLDRLAVDIPADRVRILDLGRQHLDEIWRLLDAEGPISEVIGPLGLAHGWAGYLFATLIWCRTSGMPLPPALEARLHELSAEALPVGRGYVWPWRLPLVDSGAPHFMPGWCNGSAGYVFLWTAAAATFEDDSFVDLAERAAWHAWESEQREGSLCCGLSGRAYALIEIWRATDETIWLDRARELAWIAAHEGTFRSDRPHSLVQGQLGRALLLAEIEHPESAHFPFMTWEK